MAKKDTDARVVSVALYFLPISTRVPLKFGRETLTEVTCCRVRVRVQDRAGRESVGWGETPLSVQWAWPGDSTYRFRENAMRSFCCQFAERLLTERSYGHPLEIGHDVQSSVQPQLLRDFNATMVGDRMPHLAALICSSAFDIAMHDAYGNLLELDVYRTYTPEFMNRDLAAFLTSADDAAVEFRGKYPCDYLTATAPARLPVWHLVGGLDPLTPEECPSGQLDDGYPTTLGDWIRADGLRCLKIKLRGNDEAWDYERIVQVGQIAFPLEVEHLSADFNCTVDHPRYVNEILDRLLLEHPETFRRILYVEQPFPYDLETNRIDVRSVTERKPLFLDESAHDWTYIRLGRSLGWNGVALKTCKTQSGSLLSLCWARAHGMQLMVQDLSNPMLAQIPHVRLAAHAGTIMGVESNSMQFYPEASAPEAKVHPGVFQRRGGVLDVSTLTGSGFGYRIEEIRRPLPAPTLEL
jgi:L-alanine-DL-glutamate epimerase-like enolase superfamily enzyme